MKKSLIALAALLLTTATPHLKAMDTPRQNPFLVDYPDPMNIPPFESITPADYLPAFNEGIARYRKEIKAITDQKAKPTFDNTILALDKAGLTLNRVMLVFSSLNETDNTPLMDSIAEVIMPAYTECVGEVAMNEKLFKRVKKLYDSLDKLGLAPDQRRAVEETYKSFTHNGALLNKADKRRLQELNARLANLYIKFNQNLINATNEFAFIVSDTTYLSGLPQGSIAVAAEEAAARGKEGSWAFTLHAPSRLPVLQYADNRDLRRRIYEGYTNLAFSGPYDNSPVVREILAARAEKARLLGFPTFAAYMTSNVMAKTPEAARDLLMQIWTPAIKRVDEEVAEMQAIADEAGDGIKIMPWDYYYYAEKVRRKKYNLDEDQVRAYFPLENVRQGIFNMAGRLYGVTFTELPDAPKYNPEVKVYEVKDSAGNHVAVFMTDYYQRASKRQGAWMSEFQGAFVDPDGTSQRPIVYNVGNFTRPTADSPALLTLDEVETMFHEFGHGLHGMLTQAHLRSQAGTNVDRDFVELPSQIHEHWALEPELLKTYARHYLTGEVIPDSLVEKLIASSSHNQGFITTELVGAALLDLAYGALTEGNTDIDIPAFEAQVAADLQMPSQVQYRYRTPYFRHVFGSDGYASGYYTYLWAEVLDADGFELFKERGIFDPATAASFKHNILEAGGSADPMELYVRFRGHQPDANALLRGRGLIE